MSHEVRTFPGRLGIQHRDVPYALLNDIADGGLIFNQSRGVLRAHLSRGALKNRAALMPSRAQVERAATAVAELRSRHHGRIVIDAVIPDWGRRSLNVTPAGKVLPCHAAETITALHSGTCASIRRKLTFCRTASRNRSLEPQVIGLPLTATSRYPPVATSPGVFLVRNAMRSI
jgi:predicted DNA-binding ribbon-helix-helix protein